MAFMPGLQVHAVELGEIMPRSSLGEPFAVRIPVQLNAGEEFAASCVNILPDPDATRGVPLPPGMRASIEIVSGRHYLALRNSTPLNEPVVGLRLEFTCNDLQPRDYVVLLNPSQEESAVEALPAPAAQPQYVREAPVARPRRPRTPQKTRPATQAALPKEHAAAPQSQETQNASAEISVLRPKPEASDLSRSTGDAKSVSEKERALSVAKMAQDEAIAAANERMRNLEAEVAALRKVLESPSQAVDVKASLQTATEPSSKQAVDIQVLPGDSTEEPGIVASTKPAPQPARDSASRLADISHWLLYGALPPLTLAGALVWWRRRRQDQPTGLNPKEKHSADIKSGVSDEANPTPAPALQRGQRANAPKHSQEVDVMATQTVAPAEFETTAETADQPEAPTTITTALPDVVFDLPGGSFPRAAQEAYFKGRFGGDSEDVKIIHDLDTVIEQARSIFEDDNDPVRAADLLQLAAALHPAEVRPWLALFAVYRRATLTRQYAALTEKFRTAFADDPNWPTIQRLGREIDAGNPLYGTATGEGADGKGEEEPTQDVIDRWLDVPLDFTGVLLADELREALTKGDTPDTPAALSGG